MIEAGILASITAVANVITAIVNYNAQVLVSASPEQAQRMLEVQVKQMEFWQGVADLITKPLRDAANRSNIADVKK